MSEMLFQLDSYLKEFEATVVDADSEENAIALDQTAFYPGGGGQPHDIGQLLLDRKSIPVAKVKRSGNNIFHWLEGDLPSVNSRVIGKLDWGRRFELMRTHTAMHVLCGVVWRDYGAQVTGGNMEPLRARMDFEFETMQRELVTEIEKKVNEEIKQERDIRVKILPREEAFKIPDLIRTKINLLPEGIKQVRTVEIVGLDLQADGGTHVANTREIGQFKIVDYKSKGRINKRIQIEVE